MNLLIRLIVTAGIVMFLAHFLPGAEVTGFVAALIVAIVLGLLNFIVKPILVILTIPITIVTLGLFLFVINACIIMLADNFIDGFGVNGFWIALLFSILLSICQSIAYSLLEDKKK
ncbi:phage holin family protein [Psychroserpens burtonensis]|uniref:Phage holin family protein n=1 Tax=Psychroserpens burtonensis TaxID=49278 RepID=A0A5C7B395_9FLAO|nr:phage holin family protein [Psychroserpens burtonensis]TXE15436.1 phage holin family protein [Psychroserpens burtonensis]